MVKEKSTEDLIKELLEKRDHESKDQIEKFINPNYSDFRNPFDFENMETIVNKIISAKENKEKIFIYGDYDVDGISGTAFLTKFFNEIGIVTDCYIPSRKETDYGVSKKNIDYFKKRQGKLVITVDTGYNTIEDVRYAKSLGIDVIVTDHHKTVKEKFDDEILYLNPKLSKTYKFQYLSGAGVAFKLAQGVCMSLGLDMEIIYKYLDIVMIGTIADVVPMIDENRLIIKKGLKIIKNTKVKGLSYLLNYLRLNKKTLTTTDVSYYISPLINSLGRVGISRMGADFFLKDDDFDLYNIIEEMKEQNKQRRVLEKQIFDDAMRKIQNLKIPFDKLSVIFLSSPKWHPGVIGVVSSRLTIKFNIPVVLVAIEGDYGKASCRSVGDISIFNLLSDVKNLLERYGGHDLAAGFVIHKENISKVKEYFINAIPKIKLENNKNKKDYEKNFDFELSIEDLGDKTFEFMEKMGPFGSNNPHPLFFDRNLKLDDIKKFGVDFRHFNGIIYKNKVNYNAVGFELADKIDTDYKNKTYNIVYYPEKIILNDEEVTQIILKSIKENK
ncbi:single-stranded-DNA-specific exonuclease RecJ [Fusobacterium hwasookii]|uniref:Single-stranded-DNA-specific exonuclease RecJ n=2 Tax=Fusobacterium hwasookii TaxID=1583098 RepID=A0AAC8WIJ2_9FUSO|nr:single-stranded-DNA-specific exonuclease RecJ [Fusobacterium hwasookii]ALQ34947.1 single-stranded-DNA-specific exonuclease RecJ [Fusobacterium hwasookii ChDC F206]ALQ38426.1 single-stranded-DNA-specific exonuclease RecJ [Fusobacterium hwasookii ChDC F300]EJU07180.1 single-stranded-DNA-specific exonuclease recJ [Fusobacterium hwasookii ChDC F128]QNE68822.1 single-stranded-DNA-specific exonuclease RecJ [Fusobacterium hwasookii]QYR54116.1 single-stranded-DNA-specific exonuclease RecJ [Fusobact